MFSKGPQGIRDLNPQQVFSIVRVYTDSAEPLASVTNPDLLRLTIVTIVLISHDSFMWIDMEE